jgi:hypothetical protein
MTGRWTPLVASHLDQALALAAATSIMVPPDSSTDGGPGSGTAMTSTAGAKSARKAAIFAAFVVPATMRIT